MTTSLAAASPGKTCSALRLGSVLVQATCAQVCQEGRVSGVGPWDQTLGGVRWSGSTGSLQPAGTPSAVAPGQQLPLHLQHELAAQVGASQ